MNEENKKFIKRLYNTCIEDILKEYKNQFNNEAIDNSLLEIYSQLSDEEKTHFFNYIKVIMIDTVSHVLGIIDGSSSLNGGNMEINVSIEGKSTEDDLQDEFWRFIEEYGNN